MKMLSKLLLSFLLLLCINIIKSDFFGAAGPPNFIYRKFSQCAKEPTVIRFNITPRWINRTYQVLDVNLTTPIPIGDDLLVNIIAYGSVQNRWIHLTNITCKFCTFFRNYLGPFRKTALSSIGFSENTCPVPAGHYHARNVHCDMSDSRIPLCPYGLFKVNATLHHIITHEMKLCLEILVENKRIDDI